MHTDLFAYQEKKQKTNVKKSWGGMKVGTVLCERPPILKREPANPSLVRGAEQPPALPPTSLPAGPGGGGLWTGLVNPPEAGTRLGTLPWNGHQAATVPGCELAVGGCPPAS